MFAPPTSKVSYIGASDGILNCALSYSNMMQFYFNASFQMSDSFSFSFFFKFLAELFFRKLHNLIVVMFSGDFVRILMVFEFCRVKLIREIRCYTFQMPTPVI